MSQLDERSAEFRRRVRKNTIKEIFKLMSRHGITLSDLSDYVPEPTLREKVLATRKVIQTKAKQRESLKKARSVKKGGQQDGE